MTSVIESSSVPPWLNMSDVSAARPSFPGGSWLEPTWKTRRKLTSGFPGLFSKTVLRSSPTVSRALALAKTSKVESKAKIRIIVTLHFSALCQRHDRPVLRSKIFLREAAHVLDRHRIVELVNTIDGLGVVGQREIVGHGVGHRIRGIETHQKLILHVAFRRFKLVAVGELLRDTLHFSEQLRANFFELIRLAHPRKDGESGGSA